MLRTNLDNFVNIDFAQLSIETETLLDTLSGITLEKNNLVDRAIDVPDFLRNIEAFEQIVNANSKVSLDVETLYAHIGSFNTVLRDNLREDEADIQDQINDIILASDPNWGSYVLSDFALFWESISGVSATFYSAVVAGASGLSATFDNASTALGDGLGDFLTEVADEIGFKTTSGYTLAQIVEVTDLLETITRNLVSLGSNFAAGFQSSENDVWASLSQPLSLALNEIVGDINDVVALYDGAVLPEKLKELYDAAILFARLVDHNRDQDALNTAAQNTELSGLSQRFLDDAVWIHRSEYVDLFVDALGQVVDVFNIAGQTAAVTVYLGEGLRTLVDIFAITGKNAWQDDVTRFEDLEALRSPLGRYQSIISQALNAADVDAQDTWGENLASQQPTQTDTFIEFLRDQHDTVDEPDFEKGAALALGAATIGTFQSGNDEDWFTFDLQDGVNYRLTFSPDSGSFSFPEIHVFDETGQRIGSENEILSNSSGAVIEGTATSTGTYFAVLEASVSVDDYSVLFETIDLNGQYGELFDVASDATTSLSIERGEQITLYTDRNTDDGDWIAIDLVEGESYSITLEDGIPTANNFRLMNEAGTQLAHSRGQGLNDVLFGTATETGTFYLGYDQSGTNTRELIVTEGDFDETFVELFDAPTSDATPYKIELGETFLGYLNDEDGDEDASFDTIAGDFVALDIQKGQHYEIRVDVEDSFDLTDLALVQGDGTAIAYSSFAYAESNAAVLRGLATFSGTVYAYIPATKSSRSYVLSFDEIDPGQSIGEVVDAAASAETDYHLESGQSFIGNLRSLEDILETAADGGVAFETSIRADWIEIGLLAGQSYSATLSGHTTYHDFNLVDATGAVIASHDGSLGTATTKVIGGTAAASGTFYLEVTGGQFSRAYEVAFETGVVNATGTDVADLLIGSDEDDSLFGLGGVDTLNGGAGDDLIDGGTGGDLLIGGQGSDLIYVDSTADRVSESRKWAGTDTVISSVNFRMGTKHIENLELNGDARIGAGNGLQNLITGNDIDNILDGGKNNDTLVGGLGNDRYILRTPGDVIVEAGDEGIDEVLAYQSYALADNVEKLFMQTVYTKDGDPAIFNGIGNDLGNTIIGTPFANTIVGREGNDTLKGQRGSDTFVFDRALGADNVDRIIDFNVNEVDEGDTLKLKASVFTGLSAGALDAEVFVSGVVAADSADRLIFDETTGRLWFDLDGTGVADQVLVASLDQGAVLLADDIEIF
jgi:hypothetical protein